MIDTLERAASVDASGYRPVASGGGSSVAGMPSPQPVTPTGPSHYIIATFPAFIVGAAVTQQQTRQANVPRFGIPSF